MSAESPKRTPRLPTIVPPEPVSDRSIIESVTGFINEVTLTSAPPIDNKEQIQWVRFETTADISNLSFGEDYDLESGVAPPLILILGYKTGIQIWAIPANGEATEVLSWRHGVVRCLKILPTPISSYVAENASERTEELYAQKRPLMAICESAHVSSTSGPQFCTMNIISLRDGDSIKSIKFKTTILEIGANHQSIVVTFAERIAVFDARTFEDRLTITTCYPSPGLSPNPIALGPRWLAYAERKLLPAKRSAGGCDCDGVSSYTATVLNAAKTLGKGLRELGEQVAAGFAGTGAVNVNAIGAAPTALGNGQQLTPGIITIMDIKESLKDTSPTGAAMTVSGSDPMIAHFIAHTDIVAGMTFDTSGLLLLTADKRGHDFHVFRINPHPCGPTSASVHHMYILHRGDTTAKVQDMIFSLDSRWAAITTARGTTHVFPVSPYGGPATFRTHGSPEVVNRLSRFHRSAGLSADGRSSSPVCPVSIEGAVSADPYHNPRLPPFPRPYIVMPLKQLRQPLILLPANTTPTAPTSTTSSSRQRQSSQSDDSSNVLRVCATFARPRDFLLKPSNQPRDKPALKNQRNPVDSLFVMAGHGSMIQYDLEPRYISSTPVAQRNDDTPIELYVEAKAQWNLLRKDNSIEIQAPLSRDNWLLKNRLEVKTASTDTDAGVDDDHWLSQVEIITSSGPHRRLWMGPQFIFKTYNTPSGATLQHIDSEAIEVGVSVPANQPARSNPMQMPSVAHGRGVVPVLIESGSASSFEQSPRFMNQYHEYMMSAEDLAIVPADTQLREDLADAMRESPRDSGLPTNQTPSPYATSPRTVSIAKVVNPLGTVTTITESPRESTQATDDFVEEYSSGAYIHENCDESMFRPYVTIVSGSIDSEIHGPQERPAPIGQKLIVPVIDSSTLEQRNREKSRLAEMKRQQEDNVAKFEQMSLLNRESKNEKVENKKITKKSNETANVKEDDKKMAIDSKVDAEKNAEKKMATSKVVKKSDESETVTIKLKKKGNKLQAKPEPAVVVDEPAKKPERNVNIGHEQGSAQGSLQDSSQSLSQSSSVELISPSAVKKVDIEKVEEFVAPKPTKSKKKPLSESSSSKESSVEKEITQSTATEGSKSKKKKQKKNEAQSAAASSSTATSSDDNKDEIGGAQCAEIQQSLLKSSASATVSIRKGSPHEKSDGREMSETKPTAKLGKKKKGSKESIDIELIASNSPSALADETVEFTYSEPNDSVLDMDNLSFKSTIDDQISLIPLESLRPDAEWSKDRTIDYDKLSDDAETGSGAQYSDCKSFQLIIDEPESYMRASDTNSSDETEDTSQSKSAKSSEEKTVDEDDDEELQPLICSTLSDVAVDLSKSDALPNQSDSTQPQCSEQNQQQPQKSSSSGNNSNNKKKFRKKRR